jgi:hypothetical protein
MLTKNAKRFILHSLMESNSKGNSAPVPKSGIQLTNDSGTTITTDTTAVVIASFINALNHIAVAVSTYEYGVTYIRCGTGTTEVTEDDYELEAEATGLTCDSVVTAIGSNNTKTYTATFSNTTDADIVVTEIGFFVNNAYSGNKYDNFLLDRIILDTPITIPAGESKPITYEIGF